MPDRLQEFQNHILDGAANLPPDTEIEFRKMFSGMGAYARGRYFAATHDSGFSLKYSPQECERRRSLAVAGPIRRGSGETTSTYVDVPPAVLANPAQLRDWVEASIAYVQSLPAPKRKTKQRVGQDIMENRGKSND